MTRGGISYFGVLEANLFFKYVVNRLIYIFDIGQGMHRLECNYSKIDVVKEPIKTLNRAETD